MSVALLLMVLAAILLFLSAINFPASSPVNLGWLGMFFWALSILTGRL